MKNVTFEVNRSKLDETRVTTSELNAQSIADGQVILSVAQFSFTANNISYAVTGDKFRYWDFFPAEDNFGIIPVWGFADVVASKCKGVEVGERFYGYYPMSSHVVFEPARISPLDFMDGKEHRRELPPIYNQYFRCSNDVMYKQEQEPLQMLLRPLFATSWLIDVFLERNNFFDANQIILTSASSKTALGLAQVLNQKKGQRSHDYNIVGLTSKGNKSFVEGLGCYDEVVIYDDIETMNTDSLTVSVDFAGNGEVLGRIHAHFKEQLKYSALVGASHWDQFGGSRSQLDGVRPELFFAPTHAQACVKEWGMDTFQNRLSEDWFQFVEFADDWMKVETHSGTQAAETIYKKALAGQFQAETGFLLTIPESS